MIPELQTSGPVYLGYTGPLVQISPLENFSYAYYRNRLEKPPEVCYNGISF